MEKIEPVATNVIVKRGMKSYVLIAAGIIAIIVLVVITAIIFGTFNNRKIITSFDDCAAAGFPIMESYPRQCRTSDGKTFVEELN